MFNVTKIPQGQWYIDIWSDGTRTCHAKEGKVFIRVMHEGNIYYVNVEDDRRYFEDVKAGLMGVETNAFHHAVIRREARVDGMFTNYVYYPLPLIFASTEERQMAAEALNQKPPPERWARRRRTELSKHFNYEKEVTYS